MTFDDCLFCLMMAVKVRPLWMGSKLGGERVDFRFLEGGFIRALETGSDDLYTITDYQWEEFGMVFARFIEKKIIQKDSAYEKFIRDSAGPADEHHEPGTATK